MSTVRPDLWRATDTELAGWQLRRDADGRIWDGPALVCGVSGRVHPGGPRGPYLHPYWVRRDCAWERIWIDSAELRRVASRAAGSGLEDVAIGILRYLGRRVGL